MLQKVVGVIKIKSGLILISINLPRQINITNEPLELYANSMPRENVRTFIPCRYLDIFLNFNIFFLIFFKAKSSSAAEGSLPSSLFY